MSPKRLFHTVALSMTIITLCAFMAEQTAVAKSPSTTEWKLTQKSDELGNTEALITNDAAHIYSPKLGCHLLTKAPDWQVHCYNLQDKVEWIGPMEQFNGLIMANPFAVPKPFSTPTYLTVGKGEMLGMKYTEHTISKTPPNSLLTADDIKAAPKVGEFLARFYYLPNTNRIPLYRSNTLIGRSTLKRRPFAAIEVNSSQDLRSGKIVKLQTLACQKVPFKASDFEYPKGLKRLPDIIQVSYSAGRKSEVNDMLDNIGFSQESNKLVQPSTQTKHKN